MQQRHPHASVFMITRLTSVVRGYGRGPAAICARTRRGPARSGAQAVQYRYPTTLHRSGSFPGPTAVCVRLDQYRGRGQPERGEQEASEDVGGVVLAAVDAGERDEDRHGYRGN